ncbi:nitroreductase family deazaflavin-dependent oxidoreductase [soil metagenome]
MPSWLARPYTAFARTAAGRLVGIHVMTKVDPYLLRWTRGRISLFGIYPHVQLSVPGIRSGVIRTVPLLYFTRGAEVIVIASSFGRDDHPQWYRNVMAHPQVTLTASGTAHDYVARQLTGAERDARYADAVRLYPGYADYARRTAAVGREIPVMALRPA